jgi:hypothetical protein
MARQRHARAVSTVIFFALALTCSSHAEDKPISEKDLTCNTHGGTFVLNDTDFASMKISREQFVSLKPNSPDRFRICDTRKLLRVVRTKKVTVDDFVDNYKWFLPAYLTASERKEVLDAQIDTAAKNWR